MAEETSSEPAAPTSLESIASGIKALNEEMKQNFKQLNDELIVLKIEMKREMEEIKRTTCEIEKSLESAWAVIEDLREEDQKQKVTQNQQNAEVEAIKREVNQLKNELEKEKERNIALENCTRRENIRIMNIPETEDGNITTKDLVYNLLQEALEVDTTDIRFHAVHKVGKPLRGKNRPIIVRFLCREDRDYVFSLKKNLKSSERHSKVYITADYAKAIQEERRKLVKAMFIARDKGHQAKVIDRQLIVDNIKYTVQNMPTQFKQPEE